MDQSTPNGPAKGSWRDRLGIGSKDIPKISGDFKQEPKASSQGGVKVAERPPAGTAARAPVVAKPAPMAPRPAPASGTKSMQGAVGKPAITPQTGPSLAERLKAQRDAAERLAEQRVGAARDRAIDPPPPSVSGRPAPVVKPIAASEIKPPPPVSPGPSKPKFSFAEDDKAGTPAESAPPAPSRDYKAPFQTQSKAPAPPPIMPPRPVLGGDRAQMSPAPALKQPFETRPRPAGASTYPPPAGGYKPLDPPTGLTARPSAPPPPARGYPPAGVAPPGYGDPQLQARREAYEQYRRSPPPALEAPQGDEFDDEPAAPRRGRAPMRGRRQYDDDMGDVFEDEAPAPRRRASARDYREAYDDFDGQHDGEAGRSSRGPWVILLSMLVLAGLVGGGYWYWDKYVRSTAVSTTSTGEVPVVKPPDTAAKSEPDPAAASTSASGTTEIAPAAGQSKQIYDRILGEAPASGGQIVPTTEEPVLPEKTGQVPDAGEPPAAEVVPLPAGTTTETQGAVPAAGDTQGAGDEQAPLPIPPPPGDTQGALPSETQTQQTALASGTAAIPEPAGTGTAALDTSIPAPPPVMAPKAESAAVETQAPPPAVETPAVETTQSTETETITDSDPAPVVAKKQVKKAAAPQKKKVVEKARKKTKSSDQTAALGSEPVVLVPPADDAAAPVEGAPLDTTDAATAPKKKSGSFFDFLNNDDGGTTASDSGRETAFQKLQKRQKEGSGSTASSSSSSAPADLTAGEQQVASAEPEDEPVKPSKPKAAKPSSDSAATSSGGGYVVQLGSYRSEAEALAEMDRLKSRHGNVLGGMPTRITEATVAGSTRYRAGVGPVASRDTANKVCSSLLARGERDCLVRRQ